ncbi:GNAT family N-acetyltransferase [Streptomyces sp. XD-27]|uniref:GNAT family N-acetyltransferase n=1 Tax=Streptomyces sp. XD-27 TaxID=3062779 RepID=UPI0026F445D9|nr:GNAT family N-acetyltransferase [Streptomyces sp. XD-27]WKX70326.1 GNAT family N-acetyltransferase [Streptomyces sp. XD-27]
MTTELRPLRPGDWDEWYGNLELAFGGVAEAPEERALWRELTEPERSLAAWDGDRMVGSAGAFSFRIAVPGGALVPAAGVTMVGVLPTHRRRGILRALMRRQLADVRALGEPLAVLTASEPEIYGRFGYGIATQELSAEIDTDRVRLSVSEGTDAVRLRMVRPAESAEALAACEAVYAARVAARPGMLARAAGWERLTVLDPPTEREGTSPLQWVLAESEDGKLLGYARYAVRPDWDMAGPKGTVILRDMEALDPVAYAALWRFLFEIDLTSTVKVRSCPVDAPWQHMVSDIRRCRTRVRDALHVRLVDVGAALRARTYAAPVDVVLDVRDPFCPWNEGRWRLTGDAERAACLRTDPGEPADLRLSVRELGAAYLGGVTLTALAGAGRVAELRPGALAEASAAFRSDAAPWLPHGF